MNFLDGLNPAQQAAVTTTDGAVLVLAGPGSGKTRVLAHRIAYLIDAERVPPHQIMATTFTNKAADEMRERVEMLVSKSVRGILLGTFHSLCSQILRREADFTPYTRNFTIYDSSEQRALVKDIIVEMRKDPKEHNAYSYLAAISNAKNELVAPQDYMVESYRDEITQAIYQRYSERLRANNAMDFDDLLLQTVHLFWKHPDVAERYQLGIQYLMVDEFQDTNMVQYELVRALATPQENVFVVGDPDQSIYAFRGADIRNVSRFRTDYPDHELITLDENYRSHQIILDAAMAVIRRNPDHIKRDLFSQRKSGTRIDITQLENGDTEGLWVANTIAQLRRDEGYTLRDFAVMYRVNAQSRTIENGLVAKDIPYQIIGGTKFYDRAEIKDLLAYLHVIHNPNDTLRLSRILNKPTRGVGKKSEADVKIWAAQRGISLWEALIAVHGNEKNPIGNRASSSLSELVNLILTWQQLADTVSIAELLDRVINDIKFLEFVSRSGNEEEIDARIDNINELRRDLGERGDLPLGQYLEDNALISDVDQLDTDEERVTLMTLHAAKGLEFPVVFLVGLEDGMLPHSRSMEKPSELAEERRLMYVGITRAKERLYISHAQSRYNPRFRNYDYCKPSDFLRDLPPEIVNVKGGIYTYQPRSTRPSPTATRWQSTPAQPNLPKRWGTPAKPADDAPKLKYKQGDRVYHTRYGKGTVLNSRLNMDFEEVEIQFEDGTIKRFDSSFL